MTVSDLARQAAALPTLAKFSAAIVTLGAVTFAPIANADNNRLNNGVAQSVYAVKRQAGCTTDLKNNPALELAAQRHADDVLNNRTLDGDIGSDGSTVQARVQAAGYRGTVAETVAILPSASINGIDILGNWYYRPDYFAIMSNCANTQIGVRSSNSADRSVAVAVYGQPG
ncbi:CAP domain-containing protein [Mycobacterium sp. Aquia_216]|uniref:CAP domain-containing protein n=1 Tax=Mycobacterium sp. Aquia_216 TaxID=2991729 RepID=UPI00227CE195|nr:CAP domain-containing protein [Mycobacterium sp. Aquia_216]WAJ43494.1 CAP domain-containing protein [Mycobacterium sp. Aquia_216]